MSMTHGCDDAVATVAATTWQCLPRRRQRCSDQMIPLLASSAWRHCYRPLLCCSRSLHIPQTPHLPKPPADAGVANYSGPIALLSSVGVGVLNKSFWAPTVYSLSLASGSALVSGHARHVGGLA